MVDYLNGYKLFNQTFRVNLYIKVEPFVFSNSILSKHYENNTNLLKHH